MKCDYRLSLALLFSLGSTLAAETRFWPVGDLPGGAVLSVAAGLSANGTTVVGYSYSANGTEAYRWSLADGIEGLGDLEGGAFNSKAEGVSADGSVVVGSGIATNGGKRAFRWAGGNMADLGIRSGGNFYSEAWGISPNGSTIVGSSGDNVTRWTGSTPGIQDLLDPPGGMRGGYGRAVSGDGSVIVGYGYSPSGTEAFRWTEAGGYEMLGDLPGGTFRSEAYAVSYDGKTVVGFSESARGAEAFRWTAESGMVNLGKLVQGGTYTSTARGVSGDGALVVGISDIGGRLKVVVWDAEGEVHDIEALLKALPAATNWQLVQGVGISRSGDEIAGWGYDSEGKTNSFLVTGVRELIGAPPAVRDHRWPSAVLDASGWSHSTWFGWWWDELAPWIYHGEHGWICPLYGDEDGGLYFYDAALQCWIWLQKDVYPWMYADAPLNQWLWYGIGGRPGDRWFCTIDGDWVHEPQLTPQ